MPIQPPFGLTIAVLTPITWPCMSKSGPPELPRLIAASVWMKSSYAARSVRLRAETMPAVTETLSERVADGQHPVADLGRVRVAKFTKGRSPLSLFTFSSAMSVRGSRPTISASSWPPEKRRR